MAKRSDNSGTPASKELKRPLKPKKAMSQYQVAVAAEGIAAALFARAGFHVSIQYGANQPGYDLIVEKDKTTVLVSVKGSQDNNGWGLTQSFLKNADYKQAIVDWLNYQTKDVVFCFVQFYQVPMNVMPCVYLATSREVAKHLTRGGGGRGDTILRIAKTWTKGAKQGITDRIPAHWEFSDERVAVILANSARSGR